MAVNVLITRRFKPEYLHEAYNYNAKLRALATVQEGYLHGKSLISQEDPHKFVVISSWLTAEDWVRWYNNELRKDYYDKMRMALQEPESIEIFDVGKKP